MRETIGFTIILLFSSLFISCKPSNPLEVDVSEIEIDFKIKRLDQDLFNFNFEDSIASIKSLSEAYDEFFNLYNYRMIKIGSPLEPEYTAYLREFTGNELIREVKEKTDSVFADFLPVQNQLEDAFKHYVYYFPNRPVPVIYTCISGFNQSIVTANGLIGISLEKYLGQDCSFYKMISPPYPIYQRANMHPGKIASDCMFAWGITEFPMDGSKHNLLSRMIHQGKAMYFVDAMIPSSPDSIKIGFSHKQLEWCKANEAGMWTYIVENKMLYSTNRIDIRRYMDPAPFTSSFGAESPGRIGVWIGWKIVKAYMQQNPKITLSELMANQDCQGILNHSAYHPE